ANFSWVHSINRIKIAQLLSQYRPSNLPPLNVCLHINLIDEASKAGILPQQAQELAQAVSQLPNLKLRGLMTIPPPQDDPQQQFNVYMQLSELKAALNKQLGLSMDTLSMGMSDDLIPAINAGATIVRIGRALFGERQGTK
ncbi:MAG: YggS family pyridoxal phosphate-dependent enzyme, partial [Legionella sp.]